MKIKKLFAFLLAILVVVTLVSCGEVTVIFNTNGGSTIDNKSISGILEEPATPTKEGYTFKGWYTDAELTADYTFGQKVSSELTLHAKWEINKYDVTFEIKDFDDLTAANKPANPQKNNVEYGTKVPRPTIENLKGGYGISWFKDANLTQVFDFDVAIKGATTIYGKISHNSYTIKFVVPEGLTAINDITARYGDDLFAKWDFSEPILEGYEFDGLYLSANYSSADKITTESYIVTQSITVYIKMVEKQISKKEGEFSLNISTLSATTFTNASTKIGDFTFIGKASGTNDPRIDANAVTCDDIQYTMRWNSQGSSKYGERSIQFSTLSAGTLTVIARGASTTAGNNALCAVFGEKGSLVGSSIDVGITVSTDPVAQKVTFNIPAAGNYALGSEKNSIAIYAFMFMPSDDKPVNPIQELFLNLSEISTLTLKVILAESVTYNGFTFTPSAPASKAYLEPKASGNWGSLDSMTFIKRFNSQEAADYDSSSIQFSALGAGTLIIYGKSGNDSEARTGCIFNSSGAIVVQGTTGQFTGTVKSISYTITEAGNYAFGGLESGLVVFAIKFIPAK